MQIHPQGRMIWAIACIEMIELSCRRAEVGTTFPLFVARPWFLLTKLPRIFPDDLTVDVIPPTINGKTYAPIIDLRNEMLGRRQAQQPRLYILFLTISAPSHQPILWSPPRRYRYNTHPLHAHRHPKLHPPRRRLYRRSPTLSFESIVTKSVLENHATVIVYTVLAIILFSHNDDEAFFLRVYSLPFSNSSFRTCRLEDSKFSPF